MRKPQSPQTAAPPCLASSPRPAGIKRPSRRQNSTTSGRVHVMIADPPCTHQGSHGGSPGPKTPCQRLLAESRTHESQTVAAHADHHGGQNQPAWRRHRRRVHRVQRRDATSIPSHAQFSPVLKLQTMAHRVPTNHVTDSRAVFSRRDVTRASLGSFVPSLAAGDAPGRSQRQKTCVSARAPGSQSLFVTEVRPSPRPATSETRILPPARCATRVFCRFGSAMGSL
jgi:hypothetical protein